MQKSVLITFEGPSFEAFIFDAIDRAIKINHPVQSTEHANPYGDFTWLTATCSGVPVSTLRIKSASGEIPGVVKFGKRVLYEKAIILNWLRSQTRQTVDMAAIERTADEQVSRQLITRKKGGKAAV